MKDGKGACSIAWRNCHRLQGGGADEWRQKAGLSPQKVGKVGLRGISEAEFWHIMDEAIWHMRELAQAIAGVG